MIMELIRDLQENYRDDEKLHSVVFTGWCRKSMIFQCGDFPLEKWAALLSDGDHFHSISIGIRRRFSKGERIPKASKNIEERLAELAQRTGGTAIALSNKTIPSNRPWIPLAALKIFIICLTYIPSPAGAGKIKSIRNKENDVFFAGCGEGEDFSPNTLNEEKTGKCAVQLKDIFIQGQESRADDF